MRHLYTLALTALVLLAAAPALAQTAAMEVEDGSGSTLLQLNTDNGFVLSGTYNSGSGAIPASGAGTRLMWYPEAAAFRAGRVTGTAWDPSNIGDFSVAFGSNTVASSTYSVALGGNTTASRPYTFAMGFGTTASAPWSTAMGVSTTASGNNSTALGLGTTAQAFVSLALGRYNISTGSTTSWSPSDPLLVAGNGADDANRSNALTLYKDGDLTIAGTLTQSSDARLKEEVEPLSGALARLAELRPVTFRFREGTGRPRDRQIGLLAQEVQAVLPELVREEANGYLSVSYANMAAVLVQAVNEQQDQVAALRARLDALEAERQQVPTAFLGFVGLLGLGLAGLVLRRRSASPAA